MSSLGAFCVRRRWWVLTAWVLVGVAGVLAGGAVFGRLEGGQASKRFESIQGSDIRSEQAVYGSRVLGLVDGRPVTDPELRAAVRRTVADLARIRNVARAGDPYAIPGAIAADGQALVIGADLAPRLGRADRDRAVDAVGARVSELRSLGVTVTMGGAHLLNREVNEQVRRDTEHAEIVSLPLTLVAMVVIFGGLLAAGLPLVGALASIAGGLLLLLGFSHLMDLDPNTVPVITLLSLGLSIDYALLVVSRFREERSGGLDVPAAVQTTVVTAGRTITFSALTVAVCLAGLFVFDDPTFRAIGLAGASVVLVALAAGLTLVPALLAAVGGRINVTRALAPPQGVFSRLAAAVQRRPWPVAAGLAALLLAAGIPLLGIRLQNGGADLLPADLPSARVQHALTDRFAGAGTDPVTVVAQAPPAELDRWAAGVRTPDLQSVQPASALRGGWSQVQFTPVGTSQDDPAQRLVRQLRADRPPYRAYVTGTAAILVDFKHEILGKLPYAIGVTALVSLLLLFAMTGSLLVPVKALVMNTVSLGATFGALVWVFQDGHVSGLLGFSSPGAIETWVPVLVFAFAFGLSMDYEVFLIARVKELYDAGATSDEAVRLGLQRSGRIITSAALLIVIVFVGFATGRMIGIKELGFALAVAIVVDATLVRCLLVPATMTLLGDRNWWAPAPLRRLHARFGVREEARELVSPRR